MSDVVTPGGNRVTVNRGNGAFSIITVGIIPAGTKDFSFISDDGGLNDTIQLFRRDGTHIAGTTLDKWRDPPASPITPADFINEANGFLAGATYKPNELNGTGSNLNPNYNNPLAPPQYFKTNDGMTIGYSGDGRDAPSPLPGVGNERLTIDETTEDLIIVIAGYEL